MGKRRGLRKGKIVDILSGIGILGSLYDLGLVNLSQSFVRASVLSFVCIKVHYCYSSYP
jgi:hypothetical protein